ncbi:MAG TPA: hypothetical protein VIY30_04580, partial [Burkholderiaceae bacterium]
MNGMPSSTRASSVEQQSPDVDALSTALSDGPRESGRETLIADSATALPRQGLLERDCKKALVVLLTLLAGVALLWVMWQVISPLLHTLILFALAAVLAFALSGPVNMLMPRIGNRIVSIVTVYLVVGVLVVGGIILLAGPFVRQASELASALPQYAS